MLGFCFLEPFFNSFFERDFTVSDDLPGMRELHFEYLERLLQICPGQLFLAVQKVMSTTGKVDVSHRKLFLGAIVSDPKGFIVEKDRIVVPTSHYVRSVDNLCMELQHGHMPLDGFSLVKLQISPFRIRPGRLIAGDDYVMSWLSHQPRFPHLKHYLLNMLSSGSVHRS